MGVGKLEMTSKRKKKNLPYTVALLYTNSTSVLCRSYFGYRVALRNHAWLVEIYGVDGIVIMIVCLSLFVSIP